VCSEDTSPTPCAENIAHPPAPDSRAHSRGGTRLYEQKWEDIMNRCSTLMLTTMALLATSTLAAPAVAAEVTPDRLVNADKEPQNWLMNHRSL
jgi:hypothetical protein